MLTAPSPVLLLYALETKWFKSNREKAPPSAMTGKDGGVGSKRESAMQIQITVEPKQENCYELAEVLRAFARDYETWMIRSIKSGRHTLHDEAGELIASLEIVKGAMSEREHHVRLEAE
jgi:hypothetical protein